MASDNMRLPARDVPVPLSISAEARAALARGAARETIPIPAGADMSGWRAYVASMNARMQPYEEMVWSSPNFQIRVERPGEFDTYVLARTDTSEAERRKVNFFLHGGGWACFGGAPLCFLLQRLRINSAARSTPLITECRPITIFPSRSTIAYRLTRRCYVGSILVQCWYLGSLPAAISRRP